MEFRDRRYGKNSTRHHGGSVRCACSARKERDPHAGHDRLAVRPHADAVLADRAWRRRAAARGGTGHDCARPGRRPTVGDRVAAASTSTSLQQARATGPRATAALGGGGNRGAGRPPPLRFGKRSAPDEPPQITPPISSPSPTSATTSRPAPPRPSIDARLTVKEAAEAALVVSARSAARTRGGHLVIKRFGIGAWRYPGFGAAICAPGWTRGADGPAAGARPMSVRKRCGTAKWNCPYGDHRCGHPWTSEVMIDRVRRPPVNIDAYARPRGGVSAAHRGEAGRAAVGGADHHGLATGPRPDAAARRGPAGRLEHRRHARGLRRRRGVPRLPPCRATAVSEIRHLAAYFGAQPLVAHAREATGLAYLSALREGWRPPDPRTSAAQAPLEDGRGPAAVNRLMQRLRHFINWCRFQQPPRLTRTPFHRYGIQIKAGDEVQRTRRLQAGEEAALLAACDVLDSADHCCPAARRSSGGCSARCGSARGAASSTACGSRMSTFAAGT